ncbi:MAG: hypothetical protein EBV06_12630 [Planctomycetia bacterium]|nr:hypothetical protein [Planctomycetia bacterium]
MPEFFLRVEAVNLGNTILDTDNISTRRGGGLMLLNSVALLQKNLPVSHGNRLIPIATGASIGLFQFTATDNVDAENLRKTVESQLRDNKGDIPLHHATFVVDVVPVDSSPDQAHQLAIAANRWRQMQSMSLSLSDLFNTKALGPCFYDRSRPGTHLNVKLPGNKTENLSDSVYLRRKYGRTARQEFYHEEIPEFPKDVHFTDDLGELSDATNLNREQAPTDTRGKLALIYLDGNQFGSHGRDKWKTHSAVENFRNWSKALRRHHRELLKNLLARAQVDPAWQTGNNRLIRLETLLWGGDEIIWVVPAWKGWEVVRWFLGQPHIVEGKELTYGCGLVFCHANAPIVSIDALAHDLADSAKKEAAKSHVAYEVLESYDNDGGNFDSFYRRWMPPGEPQQHLLLTGAQLQAIEEPLRTIALSDDFPMRQLYMLVHAWRQKQDINPHKERLESSDAGCAVSRLRESIGHDGAWLHLLQMLPYVPTHE